MANVQICVFNPVTTLIDQVTAAVVGPGFSGQPVVLNAQGLLDPSLLGQGVTAAAGQNLSTGQLVSLYSQSGALHMQLAYAASGGTAPSGATYPVPAAGFVSSQTFADFTGEVSFTGTFVYIDGNNEFSASDIGEIVFLSASNPGGITKTAPSGVGQLSQSVGYVVGFAAPNKVTVAFSAAFLDFTQINGILPITKGGTGATTAPAALISLIGGSPSSGDVLIWNGTAWVPSAQPGISGTIAINQVAVGSGTDIITGSSALSFSGGVLTVNSEVSTNRIQTLGGVAYINLPATNQFSINGANTGSLIFLEGLSGFQGGDNQISFNMYRTGPGPHGVWVTDNASRAGVFLSNDNGSIYMQNIVGATDALTQVTVAGPVTTYTGTFPTGASNMLMGMVGEFSGFTNLGNNGVFTITLSTGTMLQVATVAQVNETHAGTVIINANGPALTFAGSKWNGVAFVDDIWTIQSKVGLDSNPASYLTATHNGQTGVIVVATQSDNPGQTGTLGPVTLVASVPVSSMYRVSVYEEVTQASGPTAFGVGIFGSGPFNGGISGGGTPFGSGFFGAGQFAPAFANVQTSVNWTDDSGVRIAFPISDPLNVEGLNAASGDVFIRAAVGTPITFTSALATSGTATYGVFVRLEPM
jgi:hypothetical protein